jgi:hypothetical protein
MPNLPLAQQTCQSNFAYPRAQSLIQKYSTFCEILHSGHNEDLAGRTKYNFDEKRENLIIKKDRNTPESNNYYYDTDFMDKDNNFVSSVKTGDLLCEEELDSFRETDSTLKMFKVNPGDLTGPRDAENFCYYNSEDYLGPSCDLNFFLSHKNQTDQDLSNIF